MVGHAEDQLGLVEGRGWLDLDSVLRLVVLKCLVV